MNATRAAQFKRGQIFLFDFEQRQIRLFMNANEFGIDHVLFSDRFDLRVIDGRHWQHDSNALRSLNHVGIGHDVPVGIDDHAGTDGMLARHQCGLTTIALLNRSITSDQHLNHRR